MHVQVDIVPDLQTDGADYHVLRNGIRHAIQAEGAALEIGLRMGGGIGHIMDTLIEAGQHRIVFAIDPYGGIAYDAADDRRGVVLDYTNAMMHDALANLHLAAHKNGIHFVFFPLEDTEFMARFADGVPIYQDVKIVVDRYAFIHFDGPHTVTAVLGEAMFFHERTELNSVFVFDDIVNYDHNVIESFLFGHGWELVETSRTKRSYQRKE